MGTEITKLRVEVQTLVNSEPTKYDPNANGIIDDGDELSLLLSEYQCNEADLTNKEGPKLWTQAELLDIEKRVKENSKDKTKTNRVIAWITGLLGIGVGVSMAKKAISTETKQVEYTEFIEKFKKVSDGSYSPDAKPAPDLYSSTGKPVMIRTVAPTEAKQHHHIYGSVEELKKFGNGNELLAHGRSGTGYESLRNWIPGDPQFIPDGKEAVKKVKTVTNRIINKKMLLKAGAVGGGVVLASILATTIANLVIKNKAENQAKTAIKAQQAKVGGDLMDQKRAKEEEMRQREAALKQKELEYQQNMDEATKNIERQVTFAQRKANKLNADLKELQAQVDSLVVK